MQATGLSADEMCLNDTRYPVLGPKLKKWHKTISLQIQAVDHEVQLDTHPYPQGFWFWTHNNAEENDSDYLMN